MTNRLDLHEVFCEILGSRNVYYQPPESIKMHYPAILYSLSAIDSRYANDSIYKKKNAYSISLIDSDPDSEFVDQILQLPYCSFDRQYPSDNLNHFVFTIYY